MTRTIEISQDNVVSQLGAFLYATGEVNDNLDITTIELGPVKDGIRPLTYSTRKYKEGRISLKTV